MANKIGSPSAEQHHYISSATPSDTDVVVGSLYVDKDDGKVYRCTSVGPIVFTEVTGAAPSDVDYLVGTIQSGLSAEIVVGATPGGELGGTWASPTVDGTHSGSAHHAAESGTSTTHKHAVATIGGKFGISVENPTATEDISIGFTNAAITITEVRAVLVGSATPSVTWTVRHGTDRSAAGAEAVTGGTVTTSTTTGSDVTSFNDATIVADSFIWLETTAKSGTVTEIHITIIFTVD